METWSKAEFKEKLLEKGKYYHIHHPFHVAMNSGKCTKEQIQGWVANRFYYQINIPRKDAAILANCPDLEVRREWAHRISDHDSIAGGIDAWIALGKACGLEKEKLITCESVLPGVRFAVDAYVNFASKAPWQEAACSSLTELFAPEIHQTRLKNWPVHYDWIDQDGFLYFRRRISEARKDVEHGLKITLDFFDTPILQQKALQILQFKLDILWSMLDAMQLAYVFKQPPYHCVP